MTRRYLLLVALAAVLTLGTLIALTPASRIVCVEGYQVKRNVGGSNLVRGPDGHAVRCSKDSR